MTSFSTSLVSAQINTMELLPQYSYYVSGNQCAPNGRSMQTVEGTCFFVKAGDQIFLVSAKHLMTSWSTSDSSKPDLYPDTLYVHLPITGTNGFTSYAIDIRKIKADVQGSYYYSEPDIFVMPFADTGKSKVNTIEDISGKNFPAGLKAAAIVCGFPGEKLSCIDARLFSSPRENLSYRDNKRNTAVSDHINYLISCTAAVRGGYSGAPVFLKNDGTGQWYFAGIVSQGVPESNYFFVVKPVCLQAIIAAAL